MTCEWNELVECGVSLPFYGNYESGLLFVDGLKWKNGTLIRGKGVIAKIIKKEKK